MEVLGQDVRHALKALRRDLGFSTVAILTVGLGIGLNAMVFSVVAAVLLAPLPYPDPDRLAMIWTTIPAEGVDQATSAYANVDDWRRANRSFEDLATFDPTTLTMTGGEVPERLTGMRTSANLLSVLGTAPVVGRGFTADEESAGERVLLASHAFATQRFGSPDAALGRTLELQGASFEIVGVLPRSIGPPGGDEQVWLPQTLFTDWEAQAARRGTDGFRVVGRLHADATLDAAQAELDGVAARLAGAYPANAGLGVRVTALADQVAGRSFRSGLWTLYGAVGLVLLIACANAAHLILARGLQRARDLAVRSALGASAGRLFREALTENLVLAAVAGLLGTAVAAAGIPLLVSLAPDDTPRLAQVRLGLPAVGYTLVLSMIVGLAFTLPLLFGRDRRGVAASLREGRGLSSGARSSSARKVLLGGQFALALVLVFSANLLLRSMLEARRVDPGFRPEGIAFANLSMPDPARQVEFYRSVVSSLEDLPGVESVAIVEDLFIGSAPNRLVTAEGVTLPTRFALLRIDAMDGDFFGALDAPLLAGRTFGADDAQGPPVAIVNEMFARRLWGDENAIGRRFRTGPPESDGPWVEVVGVMPDMRRQGVETDPIPQALVPYAQAPSRNMNLLLRTDVPLERLAPVLRSRVAELDRTVALPGITTADELLGGYMAQRRLQTFLLGFFSAVALILAAIGVYGLVQHSVSQRTRELGVRVALGARSQALVWMVLREGLGLALPGLAIGLVGALWVSEAIGSLLFRVSATDPTSIAATSVTLLLATLVASWTPARRAARVDPIETLRAG